MRVLIGVLTVAVVGSGGYLTWRHFHYCAPGVVRTDGQCVGITDGTQGSLFGADSAEALRLIGEENTRLAGPGPGPARSVVNVAYVVPIPPPGVEDAYARLLAKDLMGVAVAQRQANHSQTVAGDRPQIRVLVANVGDSANPDTATFDHLIRMAKADFATEHLMAVLISGKSLDPLVAQIGRLVDADVPVVDAHLTANQITLKPVTPDSSLVRVTPTTADEAAAASAFLRSSSRRVLIVQNSDPQDQYAQSLGAAFRARYPDAGHALVRPQETYNGRRDGAAVAMVGILRSICVQRPDAVFFAGRGREMQPFIEALPNRPCPDLPIKVITGDDGEALANAVASGPPALRAGVAANATVYYAALARPQSWPASPGSFAAGATPFLTGRCPECFPALFPHQSLDDGYAIMAYDAMLTTITGIRSPGVDSPDALIQQFKQMHGPAAVPGASGWISLASDGSAIDKAVPIVSILPDGSSRFERLSSPSPAGTPCLPDGTTC